MSEYFGSPPEVVHSLEEGRHPEIIGGAPAALVDLEQTRPAGEELYAQDVARVACHAEDERLDWRAKVFLLRAPDAAEGLENSVCLFRDVFGFGKREVRVCEEPSQQCGPRGFVHGQEVFTRAGREQIGDGPDYRGTLLADIQLRQVEAEDFGLADQVPEPSLRDAHSAILQEAIADRKQIVEELDHTRISGRGVWLP